MTAARANWTGISQDFLRPNEAINAPSTIGAHNNFNENGQKTKLSSGLEFRIHCN